MLGEWVGLYKQISLELEVAAMRVDLKRRIGETRMERGLEVSLSLFET